MERRSLKPQLNQIRTWVRQGRTDAWIAHQLEVSVRDIDAFKREHELVPADAISGDAEAGPRIDEGPDLRAEDDDADAAADEDEDGEAGDKPRKRRRGRRGGRGRRTRSNRPLEGTFDHG